MNIIHVGKNKKFKKINDAIASIHSPTTIYLDDKIYNEKVVIDKPNIILEGNNATITYNDYAKKLDEKGREYVTFRTYTMLIKAPHIGIKDLTIINDAGEGNVVGQAVALHLYNDDINVINCKLIAHQDTLFCGPFSPDLIERYVDLLPIDEREHNGEFHQLFVNCYICGTVDFIFGGGSTKFLNCTIESLPSDNDTYIVAPDHDRDNKEGFVFENCKIIKNKKTRDNSVYLARPWREYGFVTFKNCYLESHIKPEGFSIWEDTDRHKKCRFYEEYSFGPGKNNQERVNWAHTK